MLWLLVFVADHSSSRMGTIYKDMATPNIENVWIALFVADIPTKGLILFSLFHFHSSFIYNYFTYYLNHLCII